MKIRHIANIVFAVCMLTGFFAAPAFSGTPVSSTSSELADALVETGEYYYQRGNIEDAIHEFSKALLIQPDHPQALAYLKRMGLTDGIYRRSRTSISPIAEVARHVTKFSRQRDMHQNRMEDLEDEKEQLLSRFETVQRNQDRLIKENMAKDLESELLAERLENSQRQHQAQIEQMEEMYASLPAVHTHKPMTLTKKDRQWLDHRQQIIEKYLTKEKETAALQKETHQLQGTLASYKEKEDKIFGLMEDYVYLHHHALGQLEDDLISSELDLAQTQSEALGKTEQLLAMHKEADQYRSKIDELLKELHQSPGASEDGGRDVYERIFK